MWNCQTSGLLYVSGRGEWGSKGWRDGDNEGVEHCYRRRTHVGVLYIWKLKNLSVAKKRNTLCHNNNLYCFLLFSSPGQTANQSAVRNLSRNLYLPNSICQLPLFIRFFTPLFFFRWMGSWEQIYLLMTVTWRLVSTAGTWGWVQGHALELLGYMKLSTCYGSSAATGVPNIVPNAHE